MKSFVVLLVLGGFGFGVYAGTVLKEYTLRPMMIENNCAHYDPHTGHFTWGAYSEPMDMSKLHSDGMTTQGVKKHGT